MDCTKFQAAVRKAMSQSPNNIGDMMAAVEAVLTQVKGKGTKKKAAKKD